MWKRQERCRTEDAGDDGVGMRMSLRTRVRVTIAELGDEDMETKGGDSDEECTGCGVSMRIWIMMRITTRMLMRMPPMTTVWVAVLLRDTLQGTKYNG